MVVYKYLKKEYLEEFKNKGKVFIGSIDFYRKTENEGIKDKLEGRRDYLIHPKQDAVELSRAQWNALPTNWHLMGSGQGFRIEPGGKVIINSTVPNAFCFCTSCKLDMRLMKKFKCNAYYTINDINQFAKALCKELSTQYPIVLSVSGKVQYVPTKEVVITNYNKDKVIRIPPQGKMYTKQIKIEDYFRKTKMQFEDEEEFRFVFLTARSIGKDSIHMDGRRLLDYCEFGGSEI